MHFCQPKNTIKNICEILYKNFQICAYFALFTTFRNKYHTETHKKMQNTTVITLKTNYNTYQNIFLLKNHKILIKNQIKKRIFT